MTLRDRVFQGLRRAGLMPLVNAAARVWFAVVKGVHKILGRRFVESIYSEKYFATEEAMTVESAATVARLLTEQFRPKSVADVGCGTAVYLAEFQTLGLQVHGFEWSQAALERARIDSTLLSQVDLAVPLLHDKTYDLVLCFEVAEHLPARQGAQLVANIIGLGSTVAFSAAQPGQGGRDHVNEQPPEYWVQTFAAQGYELAGSVTERLRTALGDQSAVWWLVQNLLVFQRKVTDSGAGRSS